MKLRAQKTVPQLPDALARLVEEGAVKGLVAVVSNALEVREEGLATALAAQLIRDSEGRSVSPEAVVPGEDWVGIESLSRLRSVVGGRFQNIKKKWVEAGFPLREHRGDRWKDFTLNQDAWLELATWIAKQGFEARLSPGNTDYLFELRKTPSR